MQSPIFTVIITTHNRDYILPRAIKSVLNQTFAHFELLIVDNGSTDNTKDVVLGIKDVRIKYIRNPKPTDSCDAPRNLGIKMANGGLVAFLDDDDIWYPDRLRKVKESFDKNPGVSAVCHNENRNVNGNVKGVISYGPWTENMHERLLYDGNCLSTCGITIKTDLLKELGGFDLRKEFSGAADYDFWIRMAVHNTKIHFIEEPLGEFTLTGENFSIKDASYGAKLASIVKMHILKHEKRSLYNISKKGMWRMFQLYAIAGRSYLKAARLVKAVIYFTKAIFFILRRPSLIFNLFLKVKDKNGNK